MKLTLVAKRAAIVLVLSWAALELHELGHLFVYWLGGNSAWLSFQRVHPVGEVSAQLQFWMKPAGPLVSLVAGAALLRVTRTRPTFVWATASFSNASFRIFPCAIGIVRSLRGAESGFSDEGDIAFALAESVAGRVAIILVVLVPSLWLTVQSAREYRFVTRPVLKSMLVYVLSFSVGIIAFRLDSLFGFDI